MNQSHHPFDVSYLCSSVLEDPLPVLQREALQQQAWNGIPTHCMVADDGDELPVYRSGWPEGGEEQGNKGELVQRAGEPVIEKGRVAGMEAD